jgi:FkbM family methyltransferase
MLKRLKGRVGRWLGRTPLRYVPVRVRGGIAKGAWWTLLPYSAYWRGYTEPDVVKSLQQSGDLTGAVCWDLGTHHGIYTVGLALAVGPSGQIAGFEPDPESFARCARHVRMNKLTRVKLFNAAVSDTDGSSELMIYSAGRGTPTSHLAYEDETGVGAVRLRVATVRLDTLVAKGEILPPRLIKVDVEGHGARALAGARETLAAHRPAIVMSFHGSAEYAGTRRLIEPLGYRACTPEGEAVDWPQDTNSTLLLRT